RHLHVDRAHAQRRQRRAGRPRTATWHRRRAGAGVLRDVRRRRRGRSGTRHHRLDLPCPSPAVGRRAERDALVGGRIPMAQTKTATPPSRLGTELARRLLTQMSLIRRFEEKAAEMYALGKIGGFLHLYIGQEAVAVGAMSVIRPDDYAISSYR